MSFRDRSGPRVLLPFGLDYADITQTTQGEQLQYPLPINGKPTKLEIDAANQFLNLTELMKNNSFYTGNLQSISTDNNSYNGNNNTSKNNNNLTYLEGGVNDGIKRYSDKFRKKIKIGRSIDDHPFILNFFPEELHSAMITKKGKRSLNLSHYSKGDEKDMEKLIKLSEEEKQKDLLQRINDVDGNEEEAEEEIIEEDEDDEFEDDEDDDYNAEKYFDDGDEFDEIDDGGDDEAAF